MLRLCPDDGIGVRFMLGSAYHHLGEIDKAIDYYTRYPDMAGQKYNLAVALLEKGEMPGAIRRQP